MFEYHSHVCIVFNKLALSLYDENVEHLAMMCCVQGPTPESISRQAEGSGLKYFRVDDGQPALN